MKTILLSIAAAATLAAAAPAMAAPWDYGHDGGWRYGAGSVDQREREISLRIDQGLRDRSLDWREARMLRGQLAGIENLEQRYRYNGFSGWERADLNARLDRLSLQVRGERHDGEYGYGYGERHDGYGQDGYGWRR